MAVRTGQNLKVNAVEFGLRLRELRESKGLNQAELAERLEITPGAVGLWEQGRRRPQFPEDVVKIAAVLGVDVADLLVKSTVDFAKRGRGRPKKPADDTGSE